MNTDIDTEMELVNTEYVDTSNFEFDIGTTNTCVAIWKDSENCKENDDNDDGTRSTLSPTAEEAYEYEYEEIPEEDVIGIDLGTTNTCVSIWRNEALEIIPDEHGNRTIPSFVAYTNVNRYIGLDAKNQKEMNPTNVFYEVKRWIGRKMSDPMIEKESDFFSYKIASGDNDNIVLVSDINGGKTLTPEEISAAILTKAKHMASDYLKKRITKCVITIPANFNDGQRQATKDAAEIAGLTCLRIMNEPTAAALAYGLLQRTQTHDKENPEIIEKNIIVYDFGG